MKDFKLSYIKDISSKKQKHTQPSDGNFSSQTSSTSYSDVSGTDFSFDCDTISGYSKVIFEISIQTGSGPDGYRNIGDMKLLESSDQTNWSDIDKSKVRISMTASYHNSTFEHKFTLDPWSGTKYFKLQIKSSSSNADFTINRRGWDAHPWQSPPIINARVI